MFSGQAFANDSALRTKIVTEVHSRVLVGYLVNLQISQQLWSRHESL